MSSEIMDVGEVAEYLSIAPSTVYKWVEQRRIPYTKIGNLLRFPKSLIDQWLLKRSKQPQDDLYDRFVKMAGRYHLEKFLQTRGVELDDASEEEVIEHLRQAVGELFDPDNDDQE